MWRLHKSLHFSFTQIFIKTITFYVNLLFFNNLSESVLINQSSLIKYFVTLLPVFALLSRLY